MPVDRKHQYPEKPPVRQESTAKDDFKFPVMVEEGGLIQVESATLSVATYSKFQPLSKDFIDLSNPKAVLEMRLRHFACLSKGDIIAINYNNKVYELNVLELKVKL